MNQESTVDADTPGQASSGSLSSAGSSTLQPGSSGTPLSDGLSIEPAVEFFTKAGPLPPAWAERRRHPRFYFRACAEAKIYPFGPQDAPPKQCFVVTRDLSRGGVGIVHGEQLFPGQRIDLVINCVSRSVVVVWCRRLVDQRYTAGCRFIKADEKGPEQQA
jgi:hypothetical protein